MFTRVHFLSPHGVGVLIFTMGICGRDDPVPVQKKNITVSPEGGIRVR